MRILCLAVLIVFAVSGSQPVRADQTDPRLDNLFSILQSSDEQLEVRAAENLIWTTWIAHENSANTRLMHIGIKAMADRRFDDAVEVLETMVLIAPARADLWREVGILRARLDHIESAVQALEEHLRLTGADETRYKTSMLLQELRTRLN